MKTFADWLHHYNNRDVAPMLEALHKMRHFTKKGIENGANLWSPCKEQYQILKLAVVGGPSLVFTHYHETGATKIRSHWLGNKAPVCGKILWYDANALYLSTILQDMPLHVVHGAGD